MGNFDQIFDSRHVAVDLFTNRIAEHATFARSVLRHLERLADGTAVLDNLARQHVLTFYGVGGIGKTELSRRLERWLLAELPEDDEWGAPPALDRQVRTARVDFHGSAAVPVVDVVLRLRAALADTGGRFPAFDVGLAAWWALAHPGEALPDLRSPSGFDVKGQMGDTIGEVLGEVGAGFGVGPLTVRSGWAIVDAVRSRRIRTGALRECGPLTAVVEQARLDPSPYVAATLAGLLSWDFERLADKRRPLMVVFADAAEYIQDGDRGQERLFNRIVHLTPGFLWVVTSRRALGWDSTALAAVLPATGPARWPNLAVGVRDEPHQHLVGDLTDEDVERFLLAASGVGGNPRLSAPVRERIQAGAHGLPLYLDLSLAMAQGVDVESDPGAFGGPLPQLVTRVFADLPDGERELARAASLVTRFDAELIANATGRLLGDALRFCDRTLVGYDGHPMFPYRLHDAVRSALGEEPADLPGAWAPADRRARAETLVDALQARYDACLDSVEQCRDVIELAARLCADHDLTAPWLLTAVMRLPGIGQTAARLPVPDDATWMGRTARFARAWQDTSVTERVERLTEFCALPLSGDMRRTALLYLAYARRSDYDYEGCLELLRRLLAEQPDDGRYRYQTARTLHALGRYEELKSHLETHPLLGEVTDTRLKSDLAFDRALFPEAIAGPMARAAYLRTTGQHRLALENEVVVLWRRALCGSAVIEDCDALAEESSRYGQFFLHRTTLAARLLCLHAADPRSEETRSEMAATIAATRGRRSWREFTADIVHALRRDDQEAQLALHDEWTAPGRPWNPNGQVVDRIHVFAGRSPRFETPSFGDADTDAEADRRWRAIIATLTSPEAGAPS